MLRSFWRDDTGQDMVEYTLLLAFVCVAAAAIAFGVGGNLKTVWTKANSEAVCAAQQ